MTYTDNTQTLVNALAEIEILKQEITAYDVRMENDKAEIERLTNVSYDLVQFNTKDRIEHNSRRKQDEALLREVYNTGRSEEMTYELHAKLRERLGL